MAENDDLVGGMAVANAGVEAAAAEPTAAKAKPAARRAVKKEADTRNIALSDEDVERIADSLVDKMEERGAFDEPPEKVVATAPPAAGAPAPGSADAAPEPVPVKQSWAERRFNSSSRR